MQEIVESDIEQAFADWGHTALLEEVEHYFDPDTGRMEESVLTTPVVILPGPVVASPLSATAATTHRSERMFLVRESDFPENVNLTNARIVWKQVSYHVREMTESSIGHSIALMCDVE